MEREIEAAFSHGDPSDVLSSSFKMDITRFDICTLQEAHCLNDEIIHFYLNLVSARSKKEEYPAVHGFSTFFYLKLTSGGYAAVKRWTRDVNLFEHDIVFVPVYMTYHFTLAVIDMRKKTIEYFDSAAVNRKNEICETLFKYLQEESQQKRHLELDRSEWTLRSMRSHEIPQQENGDDCGVFVCKYADYISRDRPLTFTQSDIPYFRKRMVWEIIHHQLLGQAYVKPPVLIESPLEEHKPEGTLYPSVPRKSGFKDGDVCSSQVPPRGDVTRVENTVEDGRPGQLAAAENQNGCDISGDGLYELHPASVPSRKSPTLEFEANKSPDLGKKGDDFPPITELNSPKSLWGFCYQDKS
ncbi:sentrin-specific protease 2-like [Phaenicophaeus curvirostris]|uniref:sentrin-specific protease 2-like n=1 Tax=Phaenicophaeus curvirostris TaxID=33595 RepID=UPI0037F0CED4